MLNELGYLSLDVQYINVTKIKAASNGYTFIRRGSVEKNKSTPEDKIRSILSDIDTHIEQDKQERRASELPVIDSQGLREQVKALNKHLCGMNKAEEKQLKQLQQDYLSRLEQYEDQLQKLGVRNSYSKTDESANKNPLIMYR